MGEVRWFTDEVILDERGQNEELVKTLEEMLQKAKDGEITGMNAGIQYADGSNGSFGSGFVKNQGMIGALMTQVFRLT